MLARPDEGADLRRREHVGAHAHVELVDGLLDVAPEPLPPSSLDDAEVDEHLAAVQRDGRRRAAGDVRLVEGTVVERRQQIAVHHQEVLAEPVEHRRDGSRRAERLVLERVVDAQPEARPVLEEGLKHLGHVPAGQGDLTHLGRVQLPQDDLENGHVPDRHQRLGDHGGVRAQSRALAAGEDERVHRLPIVDGRLEEVRPGAHEVDHLAQPRVRDPPAAPSP